MFCSVAFAHTIEWYVGDTLLSTTTCESGDNITPPTAPNKIGYSFKKWKQEYTQIEYLESTGTQWIQTGIILNENISIHIDTQLKNLPQSENILGGYGNTLGGRTVSIRAGGGYTRFTFFRATNTYTPCNTAIDTNRHVFIVDIYNNYVQIDDCSLSVTDIYPTESNTVSFDIGAYNNSTQYQWKAKYYNIKFYERDVLIRDFIPVLDKDGTPCMYDRLEGKFYYNAGTGQFIAGPVIGE